MMPDSLCKQAIQKPKYKSIGNSIRKPLDNNSVSELIMHFNNSNKNPNNMPKNPVESFVNELINIRQKNNKKMQWTKEDAHNPLQIRT